MAEYMLPSGGVVSDPGDGLELMLPSGGVLNQEAAAPPGGGNRRRRVLFWGTKMVIAKQSTAFETAIGPVLDADGVAVTDCVVADFKLKKTSGNFAALNGSATLTHVSAGMYDLVLTTSDTDTVGVCCVAIDDTVNACAPLYLQVVEEAVYDALFAASANAFAGAAGSTTLGAGAITATVIATGAIDADAIADNAIDAGAIAADAITAAKIADGAIDAATFAAGVFPANFDILQINDVLGVGVVVSNVSSIDTGAITAAALNADAAAEIADKVLGRNIAGGSDGGRMVKDALRFLRNKWVISAGTLTVYEEDDTATAWTSAMSTAAADPITGSDPA